MITTALLLFTLFLIAFLFHLVGENAKLRKENETLTIERDNLRNRVDVMHNKRMNDWFSKNSLKNSEYKNLKHNFYSYIFVTLFEPTADNSLY